MFCIAIGGDGGYFDGGVEDVVGPFASEAEAEKWAAARGLRGWQVCELSSPDDPMYPIRQPTLEQLHAEKMAGLGLTPGGQPVGNRGWPPIVLRG